jgi:hypothetical protein
MSSLAFPREDDLKQVIDPLVEPVVFLFDFHDQVW